MFNFFFHMASLFLFILSNFTCSAQMAFLDWLPDLWSQWKITMYLRISYMIGNSNSSISLIFKFSFWKVKLVKSLHCLTFKLWRYFIWGTIPFSWGRGTGGIWAAPFKIHMTPLTLPIFCMCSLPPYSGHYFGWCPPFQKNNPPSRF